MRNKQFTILTLAAMLALMIALAVAGTAGAQDNARPYLGIGLRSADSGILVESVVADSPAAKAAVKEGDIITAIDGKAVTADTIRDVMDGFAAGDTVTLSVTRGDATLELEATLTATPTVEDAAVPGSRLSQRPWLGVQLEDTDSGPAIREVVADSPAASAELKAGDVIQKINGETVSNARDVQQIVRAAEIGDTLTIEVQRDGDSQSFDVTLAEMPGNIMSGIQAMPFRDAFGILYNANDKTWVIRNLGESSALYETGLREGDVITAFDGTQYDPAGLQEFMSGLTQDAEVKLSVTRGSETLVISVPVTELQTFGFFGLQGSFERGFPGRDFDLGQMMGGIRLGVQYVTLNEQEASDRDLTQTDGALITDVITDTPAAKAGLQVNDIVTAVNGDKLDEERTLRDRLSAFEAGDTVTLDVLRDGQTLSVEVTLEAGTTMGGMLDMLPFFHGRGMQIPGFPDMPQVPAEPEVTVPNA